MPSVMSRTRKLIVLGLCLLLATAGGATLAAFSADTASSGNSFSAATSFPGQLRMASGTYDGNGNDNRSISGLGFQPDVVIVKWDDGEVAMLSTSTMAGDTSKRLVGGNSFDSNRIQVLEADGFQVGNHGSVNGSGRTYYWTAFKAANGVLKVGTYTGNGGTQSITGVGFSPEYLVLAPNSGERAVQWFAGSANTYRFENDGGVGNAVTNTGPDGFTLGSANDANRSGVAFHYVAFNQVAGNVKVGSYAGTGSSGLSVSGVGFQPDYLMVRSQGTATGQHRNAVVPGSESMYFTNNSNITTGITALQSDGFQLGNHSSVNSSSTTFQYVAFRNGAGGCAQPSQGQILIAANDSWVDQANPGNNNGGDTQLRVRSQTGSQNQRVFVDFDLPSLPSGCVATSADLYLYNSSMTSGRTLEVHRAAASWAENGITWNDQPATTGTPATTTISATGWTGWSVTALTNDLYTSGNFGFRIADQTEGAASAATQVFGARESGSTPPVMLLSIGS